jgi:diguanylate cyclase (GGDEF)-like protein
MVLAPEIAAGWVLLAGSGTLALGAAALAWRRGRTQRAARQLLHAQADAAHAQLDEARRRDALSGLYTREVFEQALHAMAAGPVACVLFIGVDNFKAINDQHGHAVGDAVLRELARRLRGAVRRPEHLARLAGAEFVLVVDDSPEAACQTAAALVLVIGHPIDVEGHELRVTCSIGVAAHPEHGPTTRLVGNALTAMRTARAGGGAAFAVYDPQLAADRREQAELARDLRQAIERHQLELVYQPKVDAASLQITAAEALLRWNHPKRGVVSPGVFIPIAERIGLIGALGNWVVDAATRQAALWRDRGLRMRVAINVSAYQMRQDDFVDRLGAALAANRLVPGRFTCEITETVAMEDTAVTQRAFERLGQLGVHVSIDDFGTGYSSLAALRRLPAAELKIDRAFVTDLAASADARAIVQAIVQMAHSLELRVVAEGVETVAQRDRLLDLGCDEMQGFLFAKPMAASLLEVWAIDDTGPRVVAFRESLFKETVPLADL